MDPMLILSFVCMVLCIMLTSVLVADLIWKAIKPLLRKLEIRIFDSESEYDSTSPYA